MIYPKAGSLGCRFLGPILVFLPLSLLACSAFWWELGKRVGRCAEDEMGSLSLAFCPPNQSHTGTMTPIHRLMWCFLWERGRRHGLSLVLLDRQAGLSLSFMTCEVGMRIRPSSPGRCEAPRKQERPERLSAAKCCADGGSNWLGKDQPSGYPQAEWGPRGPGDLETPARSESHAGANPGQLLRTLALPNFQQAGTPASHDVPLGLICSANGLLAVPSSLGSQVPMPQAPNPCPPIPCIFPPN